MRHAKHIGPPPVRGLLVIAGWHGASAYPVDVVGMTPKRFRIRALQRTPLAGRGRYLEAGEETLVPKHAVRITGPALPRGDDGRATEQPPRSRATRGE